MAPGQFRPPYPLLARFQSRLLPEQLYSYYIRDKAAGDSPHPRKEQDPQFHSRGKASRDLGTMSPSQYPHAAYMDRNKSDALLSSACDIAAMHTSESISIADAGPAPQSAPGSELHGHHNNRARPMPNIRAARKAASPFNRPHANFQPPAAHILSGN